MLTPVSLTGSWPPPRHSLPELVGESLPSLFSLRLEGIILAPVTNEPRYRDFPMDASTLGRLRSSATTSTGTLDNVDDNVDAPEHTKRVPRGDLLKIEGLTRR